MACAGDLQNGHGPKVGRNKAFGETPRSGAVGPASSRRGPACSRLRAPGLAGALAYRMELAGTCRFWFATTTSIRRSRRSRRSSSGKAFSARWLRRHYEKPSERRAREAAEAVRRARKVERKRLEREGF